MSRLMVEPVQAQRPVGSEVRPPKRQKREGERSQVAEACESTLARKGASNREAPVPQTDTGGRGENPKTDGRTLVKELGKKSP
jgi:hypothetical protein